MEMWPGQPSRTSQELDGLGLSAELMGAGLETSWSNWSGKTLGTETYINTWLIQEQGYPWPLIQYNSAFLVWPAGSEAFFFWSAGCEVIWPDMDNSSCGFSNSKSIGPVHDHQARWARHRLPTANVGEGASGSDEKAVWEDHFGAQGRQVAVLEVNCVQDDLIWRVSKSNQLSRFAGVQTGIGPNFQQIAACVGGEAWLKASVSQCILSGLGTWPYQQGFRCETYPSSQPRISQPWSIEEVTFFIWAARWRVWTWSHWGTFDARSNQRWSELYFLVRCTRGIFGNDPLAH